MPEHKTYVLAKKITPGVSICNVGYENCPGADSYHWHCSKCGGISGQQGHYGNPDGMGWGFSCLMYQLRDPDDDDYLTEAKRETYGSLEEYERANESHTAAATDEEINRSFDAYR